MIVQSSITNLLLASLSGLNKNQEVISINIANVDTPDYKGKKFDFQSYLQNSQPGEYAKKEKDFFAYNLTGNRTNNGHFNIDEEFNLDLYSMNIDKRDGYISQNDHNNIDIDKENMDMSKNQLLTSAVLAIYKKESGLFNQIIENSSRLN